MQRLAWEVAVAGGKDVAQVFFDAEKFYDDIHPQTLADLGTDRDYPMLMTSLGLAVHMAARM
eukprot:7780124-Prorocentrum_lima.AAC.1